MKIIYIGATITKPTVIKMKNILLILAMSLLQASVAHGKTLTYGKKLTLQETTAISAILDDPDSYNGKLVLVEGMVLETCSKRGCWVYVAGDREGEKIQVKVTDGEIVFPMSSSGRMGVFEGIVEILDISKEQMIQYLQHLAEERGQPFDPSTVKAERMIRLRGIGAEIQE
jgi:hypothetical protein